MQRSYTMSYRLRRIHQQYYLFPCVGESFSAEQREAFKQALRAQGYFVSVISPGKIAVSATSTSPDMADIDRFID